MMSTSQAQLEEKKQEARRLLNNVFHKLSHFPKATGISKYRPKPTDIIISTYSKSGTTLLQNMTYQVVVATGGAPPFDPDGTNFNDIYEVAPWLDFGPEFGIMECPTNPRVFKTHSPIQDFDISKSKFIYCIRDPLKWPASWLNFLLDWISDEEITDPEIRELIFQEFIRRRLLGHPDGQVPASSLPTWFHHVRDWTAVPRKNILVLFYEEVSADLAGTARKIAQFMGRTLSDGDVATVVKRCDRRVMASDNRFRDNYFARMCGLPAEGGMKACLEEKVGFKSMKPEDSSLKAIRETMQSIFGVQTYTEMCELIRSQQEQFCRS